jgi:hypothetical protein
MVDLGAKEKSAPGKVALMVLMVGMTGFEPGPPAPEADELDGNVKFFVGKRLRSWQRFQM